MELTEGRFHQIRRMFEVLDNKVITLHRFETGGLSLENINGTPLPEGEYRVLTIDEISAVFK
jgi:16S rRNA pseudouridine516 synthase